MNDLELMREQLIQEAALSESLLEGTEGPFVAAVAFGLAAGKISTRRSLADGTSLVNEYTGALKSVMNDVDPDGSTILKTVAFSAAMYGAALAEREGVH